MTKEEHVERHKLLHKHLDELVGDMIGCTDMLPSRTTVLELMQWSNEQIKTPTVNRLYGKDSDD